MLPQWHIKDPGHSSKSAGVRLHLNTHKPLTQQSWSGLTMPLSRHTEGTYQETISHAACQRKLGHMPTVNESPQLVALLWTDPGVKSGISMR